MPETTPSQLHLGHLVERLLTVGVDEATAVTGGEVLTVGAWVAGPELALLPGAPVGPSSFCFDDNGDDSAPVGTSAEDAPVGTSAEDAPVFVPPDFWVVTSP